MLSRFPGSVPAHSWREWRLFFDIETDRENTKWRISETGPGAESVRRRELKGLLADMEAFYSHASLAGIVALRGALRLRDLDTGCGERATLLEAFGRC
jgi:hypothetical protein